MAIIYETLVNGDVVAGDGANSLSFDSSDARLAVFDAANPEGQESSVRFQIVADAGRARADIRQHSDTAGDAPLLILTRARGSIATPATYQTGDAIGRVVFRGRTVGPNYPSLAEIRAVADGVPSASVTSPGRLELRTTTDGTWATPSVKWQIDNAGNLTAALNTTVSSSGTLTVSSTGALSLDSTTNTIQTNATSITADAGLEIATTTTGALVLDSGTTGAISIGVDATNAKTLNLDSGTTGALNVGTSAFAKTITIGNTTGATALVYNAGSGGHAFTGNTGFFGATPVAQQATIVSLTDNSGGTADDTIAVITNAANAGSADVGPTADAIADLAAKVNGILTILSNLGLMA